ncbi:hypothetical protein KM043_010433 [Ampulex compressa]|nr:hypothetical protein KM043_010433 [Ampulex compressa]
MEEVTKCSYVNCVDDAEKERIFHELPACDTALCVKWLINAGHEDLIGRDFGTLRSLKFFVCDNHFTDDCYLSKGTLKDNAIPLPYWKAIFEGTRKLQKRREPGYESKLAVPYPFPRPLRNTGRTMDGLARRKERYPDNEASVVSIDADVPKVDGWCRTCATKRFDLISMTAKKTIADMSLLSKLKLLIEIDDGDGLPLRMCNDCVVKLDQSFRFFQQIYVADNALRQIFPKTGTKLGIRSCGPRRIVSADKESGAPPSVRCSGRKWGKTKKAKGRAKAATVAPLAEQKAVGEEGIPLEDCLPTSPCKDIILGDRQNTVFSLLTDTCRSDEELNWIDVLKLMKRQKYSRWQVKRLGGKRRKIQCEFCKATFALRRRLRTHLAEKHDRPDEKPRKDRVASSEKEAAMVQAERSLGRKERAYLCDDCGAKFRKKTELRRHVDRPHSKDGAGFTCDSCGEMFRSKDPLIEHVKDGGACRTRNAVAATVGESSEPREEGQTRAMPEDSKEQAGAASARGEERSEESPSGGQPQASASPECLLAPSSSGPELHAQQTQPHPTKRQDSPEEPETSMMDHDVNHPKLSPSACE